MTRNADHRPLFLNPYVAAEVQGNPDLLAAWKRMRGTYDEDIDPLHNPDWVAQQQGQEAGDLITLKKRLGL